MFFLFLHTFITQVYAKTVDELPTGAVSPTLQQLIPTVWSPAGRGPAVSSPPLPPKNSSIALISQNALIHIIQTIFYNRCWIFSFQRFYNMTQTTFMINHEKWSRLKS